MATKIIFSDYKKISVGGEGNCILWSHRPKKPAWTKVVQGFETTDKAGRHGGCIPTSDRSGKKAGNHQTNSSADPERNKKTMCA